MSDRRANSKVDAELGRQITKNGRLVTEADSLREPFACQESEIAKANDELRLFAERVREESNPP